MEPGISVALTGDGRGHVTVDGEARSDFVKPTQLFFHFTIDQTYLAGIANALGAVDAG